jgi:AcrR family transcriptional regulator
VLRDDSTLQDDGVLEDPDPPAWLGQELPRPAARRITGPRRPTLAHVLPEGTDPPGGIPTEIFRAAVDCYLQQRRLDMRALSAELGMGRATLYRRVGSRDQLLGEVLWFLTRHLVAQGLKDAEGLRGRAFIMTALESAMRSVSAQPTVRRFLDQEPEAALRILTSKQGPIQGGLVSVMQHMLEIEVEAGELELTLDPATLAFVIVRIAEGFLYADVIGHGEPDVDAAMRIVGQLLGHVPVQ